MSYNEAVSYTHLDVYKRQVMILITGLCIWLTHDLKEENISKRQAVAELIVEKLSLIHI